ncbi:MAG: hypothetical protein WBB01_12275 [Phormidesmis sp.]
MQQLHQLLNRTGLTPLVVVVENPSDLSSQIGANQPQSDRTPFNLA